MKRAQVPPPASPSSRPLFRPRDYTPSDPEQRFWHEPPRRISFVEDTDADVRADLREFNRISLYALAAALVTVAVIWWAQ